jgi:hypothetical protein
MKARRCTSALAASSTPSPTYTTSSTRVNARAIHPRTSSAGSPPRDADGDLRSALMPERRGNIVAGEHEIRC